MIGCSLVRDMPYYRADAVRSGLRAIGCKLTNEHEKASVIVMWNRYGWRDEIATAAERRGAKVIVMENGYLGNDFAGDRWYAASLSHHNGAGQWKHVDDARWDSIGFIFGEWRDGPGEVVLLPQRGIGPRSVAMPHDWPHMTLRMLERKGIKARIRPHPGNSGACAPMERDLANAACVVTWGSGAAIKALAMGIPVFHSFDRWIGAPASMPISAIGGAPLRSDCARLHTFRRMAWAMWRVSEIESGFAFSTLLSQD